jgi:type IX secretion system PorP/SprF family membrane protein
MKKLLAYFPLLFVHVSAAQQFPQYTQYLFNKIGYNPAASGTSLNAPYEIIFGGRTQWIGLSNNPKSQFVSFNLNFVPQHAYHKWHNVGMYIGQDQNGLFTHNDVWLSYTFHLMIQKKLLLSAGVFAGIKQFRFSVNSLDRNDPAVQKSANSVLAYPDIVPGLRLSNKKFFADFCLQQLSMFSQKGIGGAIGSPSRLIPHYNLSIGRKARFEFNAIVMSLNVHGSFVGAPSVEVNIMDYFNKRAGFGLSLRGRNFVCGILQFRVTRGFVIGLAYDLSINKMMRGAPNTGEVMLGFTPVFNGEIISKSVHHVVDDCTF